MARKSSPSSSSRDSKARASLPSRASRQTIDVRPSWIEPDGGGPPPLQGAAANRDTLDVLPTWLEGDEARASSEPAAERTESETPNAPAEGAKGKGKGRRMRPSVDPEWLAAPPPSERGRRALPPPLPVAVSDAAPTSRRGKKRG